MDTEDATTAEEIGHSVVDDAASKRDGHFEHIVPCVLLFAIILILVIAAVSGVTFGSRCADVSPQQNTSYTV